MNCADRRRQCGAATLAVTVLLLLSLGLAMLYAARVAVVEQRLAANDARARAALAAAQAGAAATLAGLGAVDRAAIVYDTDGRATVSAGTGTLANGAGFRAEAHNRGLSPYQAEVLRLDVQGSSPGGGTRALTLLAAFTSQLPNVPPAPLLVRGDLAPAAALVLSNPVRSVAAWLGGVNTAGVPPETQLPAAAACLPIGICAEDTRLAALTPEGFAANTFGRTPAAVRAAARVLRCAPCEPAALTAAGDLLWLENDGAAVSLTAGALGTAARPVIAVVAGDFAPAGDVQVYGLLFVLGDWRAGTGTLSVDGALIIAGQALDVGPAVLNYHAGILDRLHARGDYGAVPGSWTDL